MTSFKEMNLDPVILSSLEKNNYLSPTEIQAKAIPIVLEGKDIIASAKTGSGKTAACAIPMCQLVDINDSHIQALVIVPTRELALQYATETQKIGGPKGIKTFALYGGEDASLQKSKLSSGVHVIVATPGRLIDFIYSRSINLSHIKTLILDEADEMLSMGFFDDLEFIMGCLVQEHQTCLFSATMPKAVVEIAKKFMKDPVQVSSAKNDENPSKIDHSFVYARHDEREAKLNEMLDKFAPKQAMIFCHSRIQVEKVCHYLKRKKEGVDYLHAGLSQDMRSIITGKFRSGRIKYLVATDVAARGLDFSNVTHVFIYELSDDPDTYVHRSGRTGRNDREGSVITLVTKRELWILKKILHQIKEEPKWIGDPPPQESHMPPKHHRKVHHRKKAH